jgi:hypothetical protein
MQKYCRVLKKTNKQLVCPLCGTEKPELLGNRDLDAIFTLISSTAIFKCADCKAVVENREFLVNHRALCSAFQTRRTLLLLKPLQLMMNLLETKKTIAILDQHTDTGITKAISIADHRETAQYITANACFRRKKDNPNEYGISFDSLMARSPHGPSEPIKEPCTVAWILLIDGKESKIGFTPIKNQKDRYLVHQFQNTTTNSLFWCFII